MKVKYLRTEEIEAASLQLLTEYGRKFGVVESPPIPVEEILESHLGLQLGFDDLPRLLSVPDVLGATWVSERRVLVDESLDPTVYPTKEGRYKFTLSHEVGHWQLHRHHFLENPGQKALFEKSVKPSIVCRASSQRDPMEWQADTFAGYLLMPKEMVLAVWQSRQGSLEPYVAVEEIANLSARWGLAEDKNPTVEVAKHLAREFGVSGQAMQIRLIGLGLISTKKPGPGLFSR